MIQENLSHLWKKIRLYKQLMVACVALNVLTIVAGLTTTALLYNGAFKLSEKLKKYTENQAQMESLATEATTLLSSASNTKLSREEAISEIRQWERLIAKVENHNPSLQKAYPQNYFTDTKAAQAWLAAVRDFALETRAKDFDSIRLLADREAKLRDAIIYLSALTIIFGVALPILILSFLGKALRKAQRALTDAARQVVQDWSHLLSRYGDQPFQNAHFWIETSLLLTERMGVQTQHPMGHLASDLAHLVRLELAKTKKTAA